ncbi:MAG: hypothetical protein A3D92_21700 [Bacteroidetes bacterium RIFCSPHIGHO2_02_FULL_44_7]|nr:MAG: hypothetical protein A3D92_21700 [Bacteroidetes bacterium RIFCSPHIGHO2_02_FULL_44_7]
MKPLSKPFQLDVLRFYITHVVVEYENGEHFVDSTLAYLLDNEIPESYTVNLPNAPNVPVKEVHFRVGTDSVLNVAGVLDGALDPIKGMYWAWNTGYINFKLEGSFDGKALEYHIGGYRAPYTTDRPITVAIHSPENKINVNLLPWLEKAQAAKIDTMMIPGEKAAWLANNFELIFTGD